MSDKSIPSEFDSFELELAPVFQADPPPTLSKRVAGVVHRELHRKRKADRWKFAFAMVATVLLWGNLSLCAVSVTRFDFQPNPKPPDLEKMATTLQTLLPELTREAAYREATFLCFYSTMPPLPKKHLENIPFPSSFLKIEQERSRSD